MATAAAANRACVAGVPVSTNMNDVQPCTIVHYTDQHFNCLYAEPKYEKEAIHCILIYFHPLLSSFLLSGTASGRSARGLAWVFQAPDPPPLWVTLVIFNQRSEFIV